MLGRLFYGFRSQRTHPTSTGQGAPSTSRFASVNTSVPARAASWNCAPDLTARGPSAACLAAYTTRTTSAEPVRTLQYMGNSLACRLPKVRRGRFLNATWEHTNSGVQRYAVPAEPKGRHGRAHSCFPPAFKTRWSCATRYLTRQVIIHSTKNELVMASAPAQRRMLSSSPHLQTHR